MLEMEKMQTEERELVKFDIDERKVDQFLNDIGFVIEKRERDLSLQAKYDIIHKIAWEWTEGQNKKKKYYGCDYWSENALISKYRKEKENELPEACINRLLKGGEFVLSKKDEDKLKHEHVVPKKLFMEYLWYLVKNPEKYKREFLKSKMEQNLLACVITAKEDEILTKTFKISEKLPKEVKKYSDVDIENLTSKNIDEVKFFEKIEYEQVWNRYKIAQQGGLSTIYRVYWKDVKITDKTTKKAITKIEKVLPKP